MGADPAMIVAAEEGFIAAKLAVYDLDEVNTPAEMSGVVGTGCGGAGHWRGLSEVESSKRLLSVRKRDCADDGVEDSKDSQQPKSSD